MWVRFLSDYDHKPRDNVILSYAAGGEYSVTHTCGQNAIAAGKAVEIPAPNREEVKDGKERLKPDGAGAVAKAARQNPQRDKASGQKTDGARGKSDRGGDARGSTS